MTALNVIVQPGETHLLTDHAIYSPRGALLRLASKVVTFPELRVAIATGGNMTAERLRGLLSHFARPAGSLEELFGQLGRILPMAHAEHAGAQRDMGLPQGPPGQTWADFFLGVACWNDAEACADGYLISSSSVLGVTPYEPFRLTSYFAPGVDLSAALGRPFNAPTDAATLDVEEDGVRLLEAQRYSVRDFGWPAVGGAAELTTVSRAGVSQRVLREWPEDGVGEVIRAA